MRYIFTASRDPAYALGTWLQDLAGSEIQSLRFQSGYFSAGGIAPLAQHLKHIAAHDLPVSAVVGSNEGETSDHDVGLLLDFMGAPREAAKLAIVCREGGVFHSKVYHVTRVDGSQTAYVGSANLTTPGVDGTNIESGVILDSGDGDPNDTLAEIAADIDAWFDGARPASFVADHDDLPPLVAQRILGVPPARGRTRSGSSAPGRPTEARRRLTPLISFPRLPSPGVVAEPPEDGTEGAPPDPPVHPFNDTGGLVAIPREGFPAYVLFAPGAKKEVTVGAGALSGSTLPSNAKGLIVRLNNDSARHFQDAAGTANLSIPTPTVSTLRFGIYSGRHERPRCEFMLRSRLVWSGETFVANDVRTNIMVYGHIKNESGHGDVRMLVAKRATQQISAFAEMKGLRKPKPDDPMIVEWPTLSDPTFKATFAQQGTALFKELRARLSDAAEGGEMVGRGACWLADDMSPAWTP